MPVVAVEVGSSWAQPVEGTARTQDKIRMKARLLMVSPFCSGQSAGRRSASEGTHANSHAVGGRPAASRCNSRTNLVNDATTLWRRVAFDRTQPNASAFAGRGGDFHLDVDAVEEGPLILPRQA